MWNIFILLLLVNIQWSIAYPQYNLISEDKLYISRIIKKIEFERKFNSFRIVNAHATRQCCLSDDDIRWLSVNNTVTLLEANSPCINSTRRGNYNMLLIRCLPPIFRTDLLEMMVACLGNNRQVRILFIWNTEYTTATSLQRQDLQHKLQLLFAYCAQKHLLNVVSIYKDYAVDGYFYTFSYFPQFHIQRKTLAEDCFPDRLKDTKGAAIRTTPEQIDPWAMAWRDRNGNLHIGGFLIKILREFAARTNSTLTFPIPVEPDVYDGLVVWSALLQNNSIDIVTSVMTSSLEMNGVEQTIPLLPVDWIVMIPMPPLVPDSEVLLFILNSMLGFFMILLLFLFSAAFTLEAVLRRRHCTPTIAMQFFLWTFINVVFRCVIGQPSCSKVHATARNVKRCFYFILFFSGIFISTYISAGLQSYSTSKPPKYARIETYEDFIQSKIPIKVSHLEKFMIPLFVGKANAKALEKHFIMAPSHGTLQRQRSSMDGIYAYTLLSPLWPVFARYQSNLPRPLYYISEQIYFARSILMCIPMQKYSIYSKSLNNFLVRLHSAGLIDLWTRQAYEDMVAAKKLNITSVLRVKRNHLDLKDFYWLWCIYGIGMGLSVLVFCTEGWYYNRQMKGANAMQKGLERRSALVGRDIC